MLIGPPSPLEDNLHPKRAQAETTCISSTSGVWSLITLSVNASRLLAGWQRSVDVLTSNAVNLMKYLKELLKAIETESALSKGKL